MPKCTRCQKTAILMSAGWQTYSGSASKGPGSLNLISGYAKPVTYCPECNTAILKLTNEYKSAIETAYNLKKNSGLPPEKIKEQATAILVPARTRIANAARDGFDNGVIMDLTLPHVMRYAEVFELIPQHAD